MKAHRYADYFPLLEGEVFDNLVRDIREHGLRKPIDTYEGAILDGRNRERACRKADVKPRYVEFKAKDPLEALYYVISVNLCRRDVTPTQRGAIGLAMMPEFNRLAKLRQSAGGRRGGRREGSKATQACSANGAGHWEATKEVANAVGVGNTTMKNIVRVAREAPELLAKLRTGELTAGEAEREVRQRKAREAVKRQTARQDKKNRQEKPREVKDYLEAVSVFANAAREAKKVAAFGKFSPEAARFTTRKHEMIRELLTKVEEAF